MITDLREVFMSTQDINEARPLLTISDLHVWYELRRFGFGHVGFVKAVNGSVLNWWKGKPWRWWGRAAAENRA